MSLFSLNCKMRSLQFSFVLFESSSIGLQLSSQNKRVSLKRWIILNVLLGTSLSMSLNNVAYSFVLSSSAFFKSFVLVTCFWNLIISSQRGRTKSTFSVIWLKYKLSILLHIQNSPNSVSIICGYLSCIERMNSNLAYSFIVSMVSTVDFVPIGCPFPSRKFFTAS